MRARDEPQELFARGVSSVGASLARLDSRDVFSQTRGRSLVERSARGNGECAEGSCTAPSILRPAL